MIEYAARNCCCRNTRMAVRKTSEKPFCEAALLSDRRAMWAEVRTNFADGTFGDKNDGKTIETYWKQLEQLDYPNAASVRKSLTAKSDEK